MGKLIAIIVIAAIVYFGVQNANILPSKEKTIETLKKEKTINKVNASREGYQNDINNAIDGNY